MELIDTDEQRQLREAVRRLLGDHCGPSELHRQLGAEEDFDRSVWLRLAGEMGVHGLAIPERFGGAGYSAVERGVVLQEMGRVLYAGPYLSTVVIAAELLLASGDEAACAQHLPRIADGSLVAAVMLPARGAESISAVPDGDGWVLDGRRGVVPDATTADLLLVVAEAPDGTGVFAVGSGAQGLTRTARPALDLTRPVADVRLAGCPAHRIGTDGARAVAVALDHALSAITAEQVGAARACLEMSVEYARTRVQFGRPIGSFQAVKHRCADMAMRVEFAEAAAAYATWALVHDPADAPLAAAMAKSYCSDAFFRVAADTIQVHGGIGFTWEHVAHLYLRRAKSQQLLLGQPADQRARVADALRL
jgi:alkylation response protein AidB-like acyl-CoA dehydrogenase